MFLGDKRTIHRPSECANLICVCEMEFRSARQARKHAKMEHITENFGAQQENNVRPINFRFVEMDEINTIGRTGCGQVGIGCGLERDVG
jgi:hypothetical protein